MATISIITTPEQDAAAQRYVAEMNAAHNTPGYVPLTPVQWAKSLILDQLAMLIARYADQDRLTKAQLYAKATDTDKATIDAILVKYQ